MDYLMKLVSTALEWSYQAGETDVRAETLQAAAELLTLRRDTIRMIDGAGPSVEVHSPEQAQGSVSGTEPGVDPERASRSADQRKKTTETVGEHIEMENSAPSDRNKGAANHDPVGDQMQTAKTPKCSAPSVVSIELKRFLDSGVLLVECPDCARTRTLSPRNGVLRFPAHSKRKTNTPVTSKRWAMGETNWDVVGGESK
jgi:hypothetical protein